MKVKNRKNVIVSIDTSSSSYVNNTITKAINDVSFIPDEMIIRTIAVTNVDASNESFIITSSLVGNNMIGCCSVSPSLSTTVNPQSVFNLGVPISGNYSFTLLNTTFGFSALNTMSILISIEFVEYFKDK